MYAFKLRLLELPKSMGILISGYNESEFAENMFLGRILDEIKVLEKFFFYCS